MKPKSDLADETNFTIKIPDQPETRGAELITNSAGYTDVSERSICAASADEQATTPWNLEAHAAPKGATTNFKRPVKPRDVRVLEACEKRFLLMNS
jgi:hypothetical protein